MRKSLISLAILAAVLLSGCSVVEDLNNSLEYTNQAMEHVDTWNSFGQEAPQLIQNAATNPEAKAELEAKLTNLIAEIDEFNQLEPPGIAEGIHQQIVEKNEALKGVIENAMVNGEVALEKLENSELLKLINEVTELRNMIEGLGA
ncbi:hypothetical protein JOC85_002589 [Bacillus mesophilus]|uniref:Lipoprotein n=1 Tax=Bacillus mesophilus TaxID=1808955 RepID=A0A6M0Q7Z7_9BACI|nr:DUF6376 family protein [Bacillus mesophilus]MBM7661786.1 hypothetical protein [Bacillus mesophilus]NEY72444.1 hypothetical protein [Bacillus mesophilus]